MLNIVIGVLGFHKTSCALILAQTNQAVKWQPDFLLDFDLFQVRRTNPISKIYHKLVECLSPIP